VIDALLIRPPGAAFRPVKNGNAFEQTVERLMQAVKLGMVTNGERLPPERELAEFLNVSRVTLREAIKALQDAGFVESRRGRLGGTFVLYDTCNRQTVDPKLAATIMGSELHDALAFRSVVEPGAAELAASRSLVDAERSMLLARLDEVDQATPDRRRIADSRLHLAIGEMSGSASVATAVAEVQVRLDELLAAIPVLSRNIEHSDSQHRMVVNAIVAGDARRARQAMENHVAGTSALLKGFLT
jgi:GntR family transcriptional regulator, transcriptional repressor for pyruvate dehydrogenase complex